jgi:multidrug efflux pump subunit AcrA (membrane-fusion protein)
MKLLLTITSVVVALLLGSLSRFIGNPPGEVMPHRKAVEQATDHQRITPIHSSSASAATAPAEQSPAPASLELETNRFLEIPALAVPTRRAPVFVAVSGVISQLGVDEGAHVTAGQVLATIDETEINSSIAEQTERTAAIVSLVGQAQAELDYAKHQLEVNRQISNESPGAISRSQLVADQYRLTAATAKLESLKHQVTQEEHQLAGLRQRRTKHHCVAPFAGVVTQTIRFANQYAPEGDVVLWLEESKKELKLHVPMVGHEQLRFSLFANRQWHQLKVARFQPNVNADGSRTVFLELPDRLELLSGQLIKVHVGAEEPQS